MKYFHRKTLYNQEIPKIDTKEESSFSDKNSKNSQILNLRPQDETWENLRQELVNNGGSHGGGNLRK